MEPRIATEESPHYERRGDRPVTPTAVPLQNRGDTQKRVVRGILRPLSRLDLVDIDFFTSSHPFRIAVMDLDVKVRGRKLF